MATEVVRDMADTIIGNSDMVEAMDIDLESNPSAATVIVVEDVPILEKFNVEEPSSYTLTCESGYSRDVERWMRGDISPAHTPPPPPPPPPSSAPRVCTPPPEGRSSSSQPQELPPPACYGLWYLAAAVTLPFVSLGNSIPSDWILWSQENGAAGRLWMEYMSTKLRFNMVVSKLERALCRAGGLCSQLQCQVRRLAEEQALRDVFAAAMDAVLVAYAVGFLLLSLCQASVIGF